MISHLMCLFMVGPILMELTTHHPCPSLTLMIYWGEHFLLKSKSDKVRQTDCRAEI